MEVEKFVKKFDKLLKCDVDDYNPRNTLLCLSRKLITKLYDPEHSPNDISNELSDIVFDIYYLHQNLNDNQSIFVSGHREITEIEFREHYANHILGILRSKNSNTVLPHFVVGDYYGVDKMFQDFAVEHDFHGLVTVYHMGDKPNPENYNPKITSLKGGFDSDEARDYAMTKATQQDLLWVRPGKEHSGTDFNRIRRIQIENNCYVGLPKAV